MKRRRFFRIALTAVVCLCLLATVVSASEPDASGTCGEGLTWTLEGGILTVSGSGVMDDFKENATPWQAQRDAITSVIIEEGVTGIGNFAFHKCAALTNASLPAGLTRIGQYAFSRCPNLGNPDIPDSVSTISYRAFQYCTAITEFTVPGSVADIASETFFGCENLGSIVISQGVTSIGVNAFEHCYALKRVSLPDSVEVIGIGAFWNCTGLEEVYFGSGVNGVGEWVFDYCGSLRRIQVSPDNPYYTAVDGVWYTKDMKKLMCCPPARGSSLTIPATVEVIWKDAFCNGSDYLTAVYFEGDAPAMDASCFYGITADCYYPADNATWTEEVRQQYSGTLAWKTRCATHVVVVTEAVAPTCTEDGLTEGRSCAVCGAVLMPRKVIPATGHSYTSKVTASACTEEGFTTHTCTVCGDSYQDSFVPAAGHSYGNWYTTREASCTEGGTERRDCIACDSFETRTTEAEGHDYLYETTYPTCTEGGYTTFTCLKCAHTYQDYFRDALGHDYVDHICARCGQEQFYVEAPVVTGSNVASSGKVKLTWAAVENAAKYQVYRSTSKTGTYKLLKTTTGISFTNTSAVAGSTYYYYVVAVAEDGTKSEQSKIVTRTCDLPRPVVSISNVASSGKIKLTWEKVEGAVKYRVYRATSKDGSYTLMKTTTGTTYTNTSAKAGTLYYYKVVAVAEKSAANSAYSSCKSRTCDLPRPAVSIALKNGKPRLTWTAIDGAVSYKIYRSTSKDGTYTLMKTTTGTSYTNTSAKSGVTYCYKVIAVHTRSAANSAYSLVDSIKAG